MVGIAHATPMIPGTATSKSSSGRGRGHMNVPGREEHAPLLHLLVAATSKCCNGREALMAVPWRLLWIKLQKGYALSEDEADMNYYFE